MVASKFRCLAVVVLTTLSIPALAENAPGVTDTEILIGQNMPYSGVVSAYETPWGMVLTLAQVLKQCGNDLSRENIMRQAANLHDFTLPSELTGIVLDTSPTDYHPIKQMQLQRWNGKSWVRFGDLITGGGS